MTAAKKKAQGVTKGKAGDAELPGGVPAKMFKRRAIARTLKAARQEGTETAYEAELIAAVLDFKGLDTVTHFNTVGFMAVLWTKFQDLDGAQRQALLSDPRLARALYTHIRLAFPEQTRAAFDIYFADLARNAPHILDTLQKQAGA